MNSADQKVKTGNLPAEWLNGVSSALSDNRPPAALVFLPEHIEEQRAIYPSELTYVVKNMRSEGVDAAFLDAPKGRAFRSKFSADATPVVIGILLSVLSNGIYDLLKVSFALLRAEAKKRPGSTATLRTLIYESSEGAPVFSQEFTGPEQDALALAEKQIEAFLREQHDIRSGN
ncbi:hypothetical protein J2S43_007264 [Catenuloplanes nepalensis]|uniref:Uncharacterized protein n=1 Tax=Catenuloplanes nepalensis TaxID=587533 RepID=A0ABT9N4Z2_9ACTN|nr:hypothetical protein [Catenuloplanes nepalensis]MDP9798752.1 hypothetical protein [Catenuloplanes nepalensis]